MYFIETNDGHFLLTFKVKIIIVSDFQFNPIYHQFQVKFGGNTAKEIFAQAKTRYVI